MSLVVGTAGHIDHGKTTLLRALTGIDADRLPEERRRGMTIDVGYAHLDLEDGSAIDFVDVPGHDALVGNMLVAAGEIDAAMLVVAADDGPRAQTFEHLELLDALGIGAGLAVITKSDAVDPQRVEDVRGALAELLAGSTLAGIPILAASGTTGLGIEDVRAALLAVRDRIGGAADPPTSVEGGASGARLAIDRVFVVRGRGVVATGTLRGSLAPGGQVRVLPDGPTVRVREVQQRNRVVDRSDGGRTAVNLVGVEAAAIGRGQVLVRGETGVEATDRILVVVRPPMVLAGRRVPVAPRVGETLRLHLGTTQADARVRSIGSDPSVRLLLLDRPIAVASGDRFALRRPAPAGTAAAGLVLDPRAPRGPARRRVRSDRLGMDQAARVDRHGALVLGGRAEIASDVEASLASIALAAVADHHATEPSSVGLEIGALRPVVARAARRLAALDSTEADVVADAVVAGLLTSGALARDGDRLRNPGRAAGPAPELAAAMDRLEGLLDVAAPPPLADAARRAGCPPEGIRLLTSAGRITRLEADLAWATTMYLSLAATALAAARRGPLTPAAFRDATGSSRRYALAILEDLDRRGMLARTPDGHVPGPRAPRAT